MSKKVTIDDLARITVNGFSEAKTEIFEIKKDVKTLKEDMKEVKETLEDHGEQLEDLNQRMKKVEYNTKVYPHDKEFVYEKLASHESRINRLELKKV